MSFVIPVSVMNEWNMVATGASTIYTDYTIHTHTRTISWMRERENSSNLARRDMKIRERKLENKRKRDGERERKRLG